MELARLDFPRSLVCSGEERGLLSRTAAGDRALELASDILTKWSCKGWEVTEYGWFPDRSLA